MNIYKVSLVSRHSDTLVSVLIASETRELALATAKERYNRDYAILTVVPLKGEDKDHDTAEVCI